MIKYYKVICKISSSFYQDYPIRKAMFTFTQIISAMSAGSKSNNEKSTVEVAAE
jgi:hypothetical protein